MLFVESRARSSVSRVAHLIWNFGATRNLQLVITLPTSGCRRQQPSIPLYSICEGIGMQLLKLHCNFFNCLIETRCSEMGFELGPTFHDRSNPALHRPVTCTLAILDFAQQHCRLKSCHGVYMPLFGSRLISPFIRL